MRSQEKNGSWRNDERLSAIAGDALLIYQQTSEGMDRVNVKAAIQKCSKYLRVKQVSVEPHVHLFRAHLLERDVITEADWRIDAFVIPRQNLRNSWDIINCSLQLNPDQVEKLGFGSQSAMIRLFAVLDSNTATERFRLVRIQTRVFLSWVKTGRRTGSELLHDLLLSRCRNTASKIEAHSLFLAVIIGTEFKLGGPRAWPFRIGAYNDRDQ